MSIPNAALFRPGPPTVKGPTPSVPVVKEIPYFAEKRILVTGASSGIGQAVATWYFELMRYQ